MSACGVDGNEDSTATGGAGGAPIDGLQTCIDLCVLRGELCPPPQFGDCTRWCTEQFLSAGSYCRDEVTALYVCYLDAVKAQDRNNPVCPISVPDQCTSIGYDAQWCTERFGCSPPLDDCAPAVGPSGDEACLCTTSCDHMLHQAKCWPDGLGSACECFIDMASVGTCQGDATICDSYVLQTCCNQYFMRSF
jgi:hypothetical protein